WLQFGPGLMSGGGTATLRERYFTTYHETYIRKASESNLPILESIRSYEQIYGRNMFTRTKPPGLMAAYIGLDHLVNGQPSLLDPAERYQRLSDVIVWLFPVLAMGMVWLLWAFSRRWLEDPSGLVARTAPVLYVLAPGVALFTFFADQAIYPAVFLVGAWFAAGALRRGSAGWAFLLGAALYAAAFFSFSMLPLYPFAGLYLLLQALGDRSPRRVSRFVLLSLALAAGTLALYVLSRALLNYDFLPRFQQSVSINHNFDFYLRVGQQPPAAPESIGVRMGQILQAAWINHLDYAAAIGIPIYLLFGVQAVRRVARFWRGGSRPGDIMLLALLGSFLAVNLAGTAQGEVPRLWLFWLPMVVMLAAHELAPHLRKRPQLILVLGLAQFITLGLTFHFQDLRM
ncbi:MAG TPA: hypothetical protein VLL49_00900, partial [Anaerolineales bacterium]|nr:hypothetical protein [Anaerolineales bacterium]